MPIVWSRRSGKSSGRTPVFDSSGTVITPAANAPTRDEADLAEREHARVADEDVDRDDDRDRDERVQEVDLVRARDERRRRSRPTTTSSTARRAATAGVESPPHTRSTTAVRPRANRPAGRRSRTRITSANTADGRKTVLSVGSAPLITPLAKPIAKPPSVAVQSRSIPPTTTPTRTTIVSLSAKSGVDERELDGQDHRDGRREHAREQDGDADHRVGPDAEQPRGAEVRRGGAHVQADRRPREQQREQRRASPRRRRRRGSSPCGRRRRRS